jgi:hypothetical protein
MKVEVPRLPVEMRIYDHHTTTCILCCSSNPWQMAETGHTWHGFDCASADKDAVMNREMSEAITDAMEQSNTMQKVCYIHVLQV